MKHVLKIITFIALFGLQASAQQTCHLMGIKSSGFLEFPPIARAAHVTGEVTVHTVFRADGSVASTNTVSGPEMLRRSEVAAAYIKTWKVNETTEGQACDIAISFQFAESASCDLEPPTVAMTSLQRFIITAHPIQTCDPQTTVTQRIHRFLFFRWKSKPIYRTP